MAAVEQIVCPICGAKNPSNVERCQSCGARIEVFKRGEGLSEDEELERRDQQEGFEWKWAGISSAIYLTLQAIILVALPFVISTYDPQGLPGLMISAGVWFVGGLIVGVISPGKTFIEPAVGACIAVGPTIGWLVYIADVHQLSVLAYIVGGILGVMVTLFGAYLGERIQMSMGRQAKT